MSLETECFSMYSDMSNRPRLFSLPNRNAANARATSVLPTPVGPRKRNDPAGRLLDFKPARERRMARANAEMAFSWLMTRLCSSSSMRSSALADVPGIEVAAHDDHFLGMLAAGDLADDVAA